MIKIIKGDITKQKVECIVNAANEYLFHGGGVAGVIAFEAGEEMAKECNKIRNEKGRVETGEAVATNSGKLQEKGIKKVIHAVGPKGTKEKELTNAVENTFKLAKKLGLKSIALPAVSCGAFGFDKKKGTKIIYDISKKYEKYFDKILLVSIDDEIIELWEKLK